MICSKCGREVKRRDLDEDGVCSRCDDEFHAMFNRLYDNALKQGTLVRTPKGVGSPNFTIGNEYVVGGVPMVYRGIFLGDETEFYAEITHVFETRDGSDYRVLPESGLDSVEYLV